MKASLSGFFPKQHRVLQLPKGKEKREQGRPWGRGEETLTEEVGRKGGNGRSWRWVCRRETVLKTLELKNKMS